jgi:hypothetical protein
MWTRLLRTLRPTWDEHRVLLTLLLAYIAVGGFVQTLVLHRSWPLHITTRWFVDVWVWGSTIWLVAHVIERRRRHTAGLSTGQILGAIGVASLAVPVQITFQSLKQSLGRVRGFPWDPDLAALDKWIHGGPAWHWLAFLFDWPTAIEIIEVLYVLWFIALAGAVVWLGWTGQRELRQRGLLALLLLWTVAGTVGAWAFASAGPCYNTSADPDMAALVARLDSSHSARIARANQRGVWEGFQSDEWLPFGGISAMPSLHVALAVLLAIIVWQRSRPVSAVLWIYAGIIQVGSVILAWHYAIDGYAGAGCAWGAWTLAGAMRAHNRRGIPSNGVFVADDRDPAVHVQEGAPAAVVLPFGTPVARRDQSTC